MIFSIDFDYPGLSQDFARKVLAAFEENNGWIRIDSDDDLPPRTDHYYETGFMLPGGRFAKNRLPKSCFSVSNLYNAKGITHYRLLPSMADPIE